MQNLIFDFYLKSAYLVNKNAFFVKCVDLAPKCVVAHLPIDTAMALRRIPFNPRLLWDYTCIVYKQGTIGKVYNYDKFFKILFYNCFRLQIQISSQQSFQGRWCSAWPCRSGVYLLVSVFWLFKIRRQQMDNTHSSTQQWIQQRRQT